MEKTPSSTAGALPSSEMALAETDRAEIQRLKERLSFYESFDQLIQDNVSRASELLKHAASVRETADQDLASVKREMEQQRSGERQEVRALLSGLLDDVTSMQVQIERLARRVSDALDDVEVTLPAGLETAPLAATASAVNHVGPTTFDGPPGLALDPTPDEIGPPEPEESEAEFRGLVADEPRDEVEAAAAAAQAAEAPVDSVEEFNASVRPAAEQAEDVLIATTSQPEFKPETPQSIDEIVQPPAAPVESGTVENIAPVPIEVDSVLSETSIAQTSQPIAEVAPVPTIEAPPVTPEAVLVEPVTAPAANEESAAPRLSWISQDVRPFSMEGSGSGVRPPGTTEQRTPEPSPQPDSVSSSSPSQDAPGIATAVLVHGVPRATTALSLKRFLEGLPQVTGVEPREYAEGILRLHVICERPLQIDDLRGWPDGAGMEPVHVRDDLIEVRLPH